MLYLLATAAAALIPQPAADHSVMLPPPERRQQLLFDAATLGRTDLIAPLVAAGADPNERDSRGFTPIILASYNDHLDTTEALINAGGDPCRPDGGQGNTAQMGVAFKGYDAIAKRLLAAKCDVNARNNSGQTALMMAALFGRAAQIDMLLTAGADRSATDRSGRSASTLAAAQGNRAVVDQLGASLH